MYTYLKKLTTCIVILMITIVTIGTAQNNNNAYGSTRLKAGDKVIPGAERVEVYMPLLKGKKVALFANATSMVGNKHIVDVLQENGVNVGVIFGPEHGFRGDADAGEKVSTYTDKKTGIKVVSLYGDKKKPSKDDLTGIDIMVFDIQDVGVRFYTYISSLQDYMETAFEYRIPLLILDRPNPNGHYVDGPVLNRKYTSFVGMQPVPVVYGLTIGEYAMMISGEEWLSAKANAQQRYFKQAQNTADTPFHFLVIKCSNYDHNTLYRLPVKPSPNLPDIQSVYLYPSVCFFEGTVFSEGRGTDKPFQVFGHPDLPQQLYSFTPNPNAGAKSSKHYGKKCYGWDLSGTETDVLAKTGNQLQLKWLLDAYKAFPEKDKFFILPKSGNMEGSFFNKLAGNNTLWQQVKAGTTEAAIRASWQPDLDNFKQVRKKYLLYDDFQ